MSVSVRVVLFHATLVIESIIGALILQVLNILVLYGYKYKDLLTKYYNKREALQSLFIFIFKLDSY